MLHKFTSCIYDMEVGYRLKAEIKEGNLLVKKRRLQ